MYSRYRYAVCTVCRVGTVWYSRYSMYSRYTYAVRTVGIGMQYAQYVQ